MGIMLMVLILMHTCWRISIFDQVLNLIMILVYHIPSYLIDLSKSGRQKLFSSLMSLWIIVWPQLNISNQCGSFSTRRTNQFKIGQQKLDLQLSTDQ